MSGGSATADAASIRNALWPSEDPTQSRVFALLDGARDPRIVRMLRDSGLEYDCMFAGVQSFRYRAAAPHIVELPLQHRVTDQLLGEAWGRSWGVFVRTPREVWLGTVRFHFRQFLRVKDETGRILFFRFYDPRVLRVYLPTCTDVEAKAFLGPATRIVAEEEDGESILTYEVGDEGLRVTRSNGL